MPLNDPSTLLLTALALLLAGLVIWVFNRLIMDRNQVATAWSDVDVQLQRRHDLVPQLVNVARGYAVHESEVLERVVAERTACRNAARIADRGPLETALGEDLLRVVALVEAYPELKADASFAQLSRELVKVEDSLQSARRFYNGSVRQLNNRIQVFPHLLVARAFGFREAEFFAADDGTQAAPQVRL